MKRLLVFAVLLAGCSGAIGAPFEQPLPGREDVTVTELKAHVTAGLSDSVGVELPTGTESALIEVQGATGNFRLAQLQTPSGVDLVESGGFMTRDARSAPGLVDWLYPNTPSLMLQPGRHLLRLTALDANGAPIDEDVTVRVYQRARPSVPSSGQLKVDLLIAEGAGLDSGTDPQMLGSQLIDLVGAVYAQAHVSIADYTVSTVSLPSADLSLASGVSSPAVTTAVRTALAHARDGALHLVFVRSLDDGGGTLAGYSLGLPGAVALDRPTAAVLVALAPFASPTDGSLDVHGLAITCAHEMGHYLGLYHTSERDGMQHDPIPDTPECAPGEQCPDANNVMFWTGGGTRSLLTDGQSAVMRMHPLAAPGAPLVTSTPMCQPGCAAPEVCAIVDGEASCHPACDPSDASSCASGSCTPSDDGTYVCR